jgi:hypothetical protein
MSSTTLSTQVSLPVDEAWARFREYTYRRAIGRGQSAAGMIAWHPSDDAATDGIAEFRAIEGGTQIRLSLSSEGDQLTVKRAYERYLDGFRMYAEGEVRPAVEIPLGRAA